MLADIWIRTEAPNLDPNFKQKELLDLFRKSKQEEMMTEDEIETLRSLPETVSVYRGVTSYNAGKIKALSWTLDQKVSQWFANRFGENGTVYEAEISKEYILALFKGRNEWEVIVEPDHLLQLSEALEENMEWTIVNKVDTIYKEKCRVQLLSAVPSTILLFHLVSSFRENYAVSWHYRILRCIRIQITGVPAENDMFYG